MRRARARGSIAAPAPTTTSSACIAGRGRRSSASCSTWRTDPAVDALHRAVAAAGGPVGAPAELAGDGGGYGFGCKDPDGRNLAFVTGCADHADSKDQPDRPRKIAHVNLNTSDFDGSLRFFTQTLGFRQIDENAPLWFLRCASSDHSSIVLARTNQPTLNHVAFEMPDVDSVMRGMGRMKDNGYPIEWGPGRHGPGNNVFAYFCGPDEVPIEYTSEVLQVDDGYVARGSDYWKFPPGRSDQWGITQPRSARYYRVQRLFGFTEDGWRVCKSVTCSPDFAALNPGYDQYDYDEVSRAHPAPSC